MESAARWAREYEATEDYMSYPRHFERITMARVLLGEDRTDEARTPSATCWRARDPRAGWRMRSSF